MAKIVDASLVQAQLLEELRNCSKNLLGLKPAYAQRMPYANNGFILRRCVKSTTIEHSI